MYTSPDIIGTHGLHHAKVSHKLVHHCEALHEPPFLAIATSGNAHKVDHENHDAIEGNVFPSTRGGGRISELPP